MSKQFVLAHRFILLLFGLSYATILRLPCKKNADFHVLFSGKKLIDNVLMSFNGLRDTECMMKCIENAKCRSYNTNTNDRRCEVNGKALVDNGTKLVTDANWIYKSTDYSSTLIGPVCNSLKPCSDKVLCKDTCDPPFYKCVYCDSNHKGLHCDVAIDRDECESNPCKNSGTCVDGYADYKCLCLNGFTGKNCETVISYCDSLPCQNGATCKNGQGDYTCRCIKNYYGSACETLVLNITIRSYGFGDPNFTYAKVRVNGEEIGTAGRGFNVVVLSPTNGQQLGAKNFDTYLSASASDEMVNFIKSFPDASIIAIATIDDAAFRLKAVIREYLYLLGSIGSSSISYRSTFALLTAKGTTKPSWFAENYAARDAGPSIINAHLQFPAK